MRTYITRPVSIVSFSINRWPSFVWSTASGFFTQLLFLLSLTLEIGVKIWWTGRLYYCSCTGMLYKNKYDTIFRTWGLVTVVICSLSHSVTHSVAHSLTQSLSHCARTCHGSDCVGCYFLSSGQQKPRPPEPSQHEHPRFQRRDIRLQCLRNCLNKHGHTLYMAF